MREFPFRNGVVLPCQAERNHNVSASYRRPRGDMWLSCPDKNGVVQVWVQMLGKDDAKQVTTSIEFDWSGASINNRAIERGTAGPSARKGVLGDHITGIPCW